MPGTIVVEPDNIHITLLQGPDGQPQEVILGLVVPGKVAPELAQLYRQAAFDNSAFQSHDPDYTSQWAVEPKTKRIHLFVSISDPLVAFDLVMRTETRFQGTLRAAYIRPAGVGIGIFLYDSDADAERAPGALESEDWALFNSLGVGVGRNLDMRPLGLAFKA